MSTHLVRVSWQSPPIKLEGDAPVHPLQRMRDSARQERFSQFHAAALKQCITRLKEVLATNHINVALCGIIGPTQEEQHVRFDLVVLVPEDQVGDVSGHLHNAFESLLEPEVIMEKKPDRKHARRKSTR